MEHEERICNKCGTKLELEDSSCPKCGRLFVDRKKSRLGREQTSSVPPPPLSKSPPPPPTTDTEVVEMVRVEEETVAEASEQILPLEEIEEKPVELEPIGVKHTREIIWPTQSLTEEIDKLGIDEESQINKERSSDVVDVTTEAGIQIMDFAPNIDTLGFDMRAERMSGTWGGVLTRALENPSKTQRCLQYIYVYTRQHTVISYFWMVFVPALMILWTFLIPLLFPSEMSLFNSTLESEGFLRLILTPSQAWIPMLMTGLVCLPLFITGLWPHIAEARKGIGSRLRFRSTSLLVFLGALMWGVFFYDLLFWIIIIVWAFCAVMWRVRPTGHEMDYIPIFVWIKKMGNTWSFDCAAWDYFHYYAEKMSRDELEKENVLKKGQNVCLLMDNPWHSLFLGSRELKKELNMMTGSIVLFIISILAIVYLYLADVLAGYEWGNWLLLGLFFVLSSSGCLIARFPFSLIKDPKDYTVEGSHLTDDKLRVLWNLGTDEVSRKGRFIAITKMQDPFSTEADFTSFRDDE